MNLVCRMLVGATMSLLGAVVFAPGSNAADPVAANAALLEKYFADVNTRNLAALKDVISDNYVQHGAYQGQGLAGMQAAFRHDFEMFPDFHWTVEDSVITNDKIVARFRITATHDHPVQFAPGAPLFPPTGKKLSWEGISIWRVADGKFVEHWDVDDLLGVVQQMRTQPAAQTKQP
ncbi:MAG TPA: ester cyclase [Thermomicrobiaceae bacterium]|nr:ester cyclase [Thermomicrobiaceae bacterium]